MYVYTYICIYSFDKQIFKLNHKSTAWSSASGVKILGKCTMHALNRLDNAISVCQGKSQTNKKTYHAVLVNDHS